MVRAAKTAAAFACLAASMAFTALLLRDSRWEPPGEKATTIMSLGEGSIATAEPDRVSHGAIARIFPAVKAEAAIARVKEESAEAPAQKAALEPLPAVKYVGSVSGSDGRTMYYLKNETNGRIIRVGQGVSDGSIEFVGATKNSVTISISGRELSVAR